MDTAEGLRPEQVEQIDFATVRRGYEPEPVRERLREAAAEIRRLHDVIAEQSERLSQLEATPPGRLEEARVAEALGDETVKVLQAARDAAQQRLERADAEIAEMMERAHAAAAAIVDEGRDRGREVVQQAKSVRERILVDLARKRKTHRAEVEQLRTIRDRLLEALSICQQGLGEWVDELVQVVPQARAAAERAGLLIAAEPEPTVEEIEAEIETGRLMGLPLDGLAAGSGDPDVAPADDWDAEDSAAISDALEVLEDSGPEAAESIEPVSSADRSAAATAPGSRTVGPYDMESESGGRVDPPPIAAFGGYRPPLSTGPVPRVFADVQRADSGPDEDDQPVDVVLEEDDEPVDVVLDTDVELTEVADEGAVLAEDTADDDAEGAPETSSAASADAIFARLRALGETPVQATEDTESEAPEPAAGPEGEEQEPSAADSEEQEPSAADSEEQEPSAADEAEDAAVEPAAADDAEDAAVEPAEEGDLIGAARQVAVGEIARGLKRMVVDEQGELLDALRRIGPRALEGPITAQERPYTRVVRGPLEDFASYIDVSIDDIDLQAAGKAVVSVLVEPVKSRLRELSTSTDDIDQLSAAVRAIYRESRSKRADEAAEEAFAKGWNDPVA